MTAETLLTGRGATRRRYIYTLWTNYVRNGNLSRLDRWLAHYMRRFPQFGKRDRAAYADAIFAMARFSGPALVFEHAFAAGAGTAKRLEDAWQSRWPRAESDWRQALAETSPETLLYWVEVLSESQTGGTDDAVEKRRAWLNGIKTNIPDGLGRLIAAGIPPFLAPVLQERVSLSTWDDAARTKFLSNLQRRPPLWLRVLRRDVCDRVVHELRCRGIEPRVSGSAIAVAGDANIRGLDAYRKGLVEIQDLASQAIVEKLGAQAGDYIWDACAGGGGKTVAVASMLGASGMVYASDIREYKLDELQERARRAGLGNIRAFAADATQVRQWDREILRRGGFDRVLIDAPCSESGRWRRSPDARWRTSNESVERHACLQSRLISACASAVRPGGILAYTTCSWLPAENEHIAEHFLSHNSGWTVQRMGMLGSPDEDADSMFAAILRRNN